MLIPHWLIGVAIFAGLAAFIGFTFRQGLRVTRTATDPDDGRRRGSRRRKKSSPNCGYRRPKVHGPGHRLEVDEYGSPRSGLAAVASSISRDAELRPAYLEVGDVHCSSVPLLGMIVFRSILKRSTHFWLGWREFSRADELWFDRHSALAFCLSMIPRVTPEGMLFGKPDSTFPDHALSGDRLAPKRFGEGGNPPVALSHRIYFQPDSLSQAATSAGCDFSQAVIERVSSDDILLFMHEHHAATTSGVAPSRLLSLTHFLIQAASSASASAGVIDEAKPRPMTPRRITTAKETILAFIGFFLSGRSIGLKWPASV